MNPQSNTKIRDGAPGYQHTGWRTGGRCPPKLPAAFPLACRQVGVPPSRRVLVVRPAWQSMDLF